MIKQLFTVILFLLLLNISCKGKTEKVGHNQTHIELTKNSLKSKLPIPIFEENNDFVELYWKAWELAFDHIKEQPGLIQSPYVDEAFWDNTIWIWDTEFMVLFCKYAPDVFPGIESLNNFYGSILDKKPSPLKIQHPDNPPFFAWVESEYFKFTNDEQHLEKLINQTKYLQRHFEWFDNLKPGTKLHFPHSYIAVEKKELGYRWGGVQSGMDNTPRGRNSRGTLLWIDAIAQQALAANKIVELASYAGNSELKLEYQKKYNDLKQIINTYYWDKEDGFYYDIDMNSKDFVKVKTPASYWVLLAGVASQSQAESMAKYASKQQNFGGKFPWPTVSRDDKAYNERYGDYWRGGVWLPTAYMATKALEQYGFYEVANINAKNLLTQMSETYKTFKPATIWECYSPSVNEPSRRIRKDHKEIVRPDFCGWSALGPISMFIENVIGIYSVDAKKNELKWNIHHESKHGIRNFKFGSVVTDLIYENGTVKIKSNSTYKLIIGDKQFEINEGDKIIKL
jgi:glycogen debranching enzyme